MRRGAFAFATVLVTALPLAQQYFTPPITEEAPKSEPKARPKPAVPTSIKTLANVSSLWHGNVKEEGKSAKVALDSRGSVFGSPLLDRSTL